LRGRRRDTAPEEGAEQQLQKPPPLILEVVRRMFKEKPLGSVGLIILIIFFIVGFASPILAPHDIYEINLIDRLQGPSSRYFLGTDNLGRDMLSRIIWGARISMTVGVFGACFILVVSTAIGMTSAFIGGKFDLIVQRFVDAWGNFPPLLLLLTVMAVVGPGIPQIIFVLGIQRGIGGSRFIRSLTFAMRENVYVDAARAIGAPTRRILLRHIFPNIAPPIIIQFSGNMAGMIMQEAGLSFLGYGIPPPLPSWGGMLGGTAREFMYQAPWMCIWPGLVLSLTIFGINMFGDGLRDILDPRLRGGLGRYGRAMKEIKKPETESEGSEEE